MDMPSIAFTPVALNTLYLQKKSDYTAKNPVTVTDTDLLLLEMDFNKAIEHCNKKLYPQLLALFEGHPMDYSHYILKLDKKAADTAFILRMNLVYQLHIIAYWTLKKLACHTRIYGATPFKEVDVDAYSLGIFGSDDYTSDIDVGVRYAGSGNSVQLHWVVQVLEDAYEKHLGISSLKLDVETYGNTETVQIAGKEVYFMDTSQFSLQDFEQMVPYALASMIRNVATAINVQDDQSCDSKCHNDYCPKCSDDIQNIKLDQLVTPAEFPQMFDVLPELSKILNDESTKRAQTMVASYVKLPYDTARLEYYKLIHASETNLMKTIKPILDRGGKLSTPQILTAMQLSAMALLYRKESYLLGPTITHVVRIMQGQLNDPIENCPNATPICSLGLFGFVLSMLEQIGYIKRMQLTYCVPGPESFVLKCTKKLIKYVSRFNDAVARLQRRNSVPQYSGFAPRRLPQAPPLATLQAPPQAPKKNWLGWFKGGSRNKSARAHKKRPKNKSARKRTKNKSKKSVTRT